MKSGNPLPLALFSRRRSGVLPRWVVLSLLVVAVYAAGQAAAADAERPAWQHQWPQWRGPSADGVARHADPPLHWSNTQNVRWKREIPGEGSATPIVWGDQIFLAAAIETERLAENPPKADASAKTNPPPNIYQFVVISLDRDSGRENWRRVACEEVPHEGRHSTNSFASASPTTDGKRLYVSFGSRGIYCFDLQGKPLWNRDLGDMRTRYGWGEATSPVAHGDSLIINWDHEDQSFIEVLNAADGKTLWKEDRDEPTSWATPLVVEHKGTTQVIVNGTNRVRSYDLATGNVIWQLGGQTVNAIPSPLAADGVAYCMSGYRGAFAAAVSLDAKGDLGDGPADAGNFVRWKHARGTPYVPSPILVDNQLYFTRANTAVLSALDAATGKPVFGEQRLPGLSNIYASPVAARGRIYFTGRDGTTLVLQHGPELKVLATNSLDEPIDASPALVGDQLFLRTSKHVYCIEETDKAAAIPDPAEKTLNRAIAFLSRETPLWRKENKCFSCHNNGDAARTLYIAENLGYEIAPEILAETTAWLAQPKEWEHNGGEGEFNEKDLSSMQFGTALATAIRTGHIEDESPLATAASMIADLQQKEGFWKMNAQGTIGGPVNYGNALGTAEALQVLRQTGDMKFKPHVERGERWLRRATPQNVLEAAGLLIGLGTAGDDEAARQRRACTVIIEKGQSEAGGWGPYVNSSPEPYDTAVVLLALAGMNRDVQQDEMIAAGRRYLAASQLEEGSWPETTRPPNGVSYAQRLSTAGWATRALLLTSPKQLK